MILLKMPFIQLSCLYWMDLFFKCILQTVYVFKYVCVFLHRLISIYFYKCASIYKLYNTKKMSNIFFYPYSTDSIMSCIYAILQNMLQLYIHSATFYLYVAMKHVSNKVNDMHQS